MCKVLVCFDLDDTLYPEMGYLRAAYNAIALHLHKETQVEKNVIYAQMMDSYLAKKSAFHNICSVLATKETPESLLQMYRTLKPSIVLHHDTIEVLNALKRKNISMGIITDGRSVTQNNKIEALELNKWIEKKCVVISEEFGSEKPSLANYTYFDMLFPDYKKVYVGDNIKKDFVTPNQLGWLTVCLANQGENIHSQNIEVLPNYMPQITIQNIKQLPALIDNFAQKH